MIVLVDVGSGNVDVFDTVTVLVSVSDAEENGESFSDVENSNATEVYTERVGDGQRHLASLQQAVNEMLIEYSGQVCMHDELSHLEPRLRDMHLEVLEVVSDLASIVQPMASKSKSSSSLD